jgi:hypothetical protein
MEAPTAEFNTVEAPTPSGNSRQRSASLLNVLLAVAVVVAVGGVSFAVGRATAPTRMAVGVGNFGGGGNFPNGGNQPNGRPGAGAGFGGFGGRLGGATLRGTVTAVGAGTITIQLTGGATITVGTDGTTTYHQQVAGTSADVSSGKQVLVQLGSFNRTGNQVPGTGPTGPIGTASDVTVVAP